MFRHFYISINVESGADILVGLSETISLSFRVGFTRTESPFTAKGSAGMVNTQGKK